MPFDDAAAQTYGVIRAALEKEGRPIGPNDMLIAAIAGKRADRGDSQHRRARAGAWIAPPAASGQPAHQRPAARAVRRGVLPIAPSRPVSDPPSRTLRSVVELDRQPVEASSQPDGRGAVPPAVKRVLEQLPDALRAGFYGPGDRVTLCARLSPSGLICPSSHWRRRRPSAGNRPC